MPAHHFKCVDLRKRKVLSMINIHTKRFEDYTKITNIIDDFLRQKEFMINDPYEVTRSPAW